MSANRDWLVGAPAFVVLGAFLIAIGYSIYAHEPVRPTPQDLWLARQRERCQVMGGRLTATVYSEKIVAECYRHVFWRQSTNMLFKVDFKEPTQ